MATRTEIKVISVDTNDLNNQQWQWSGTCLCGQEVSGTELGTVKQILLNIACTVCTTCEAMARD